MTKADIVDRISEETGLTKVETETVIDGFFAVVSDSLIRGKRIDFRGFGSFSVKKRKSKIARNPGTGESVDVPERFVPVYKPSKILKDAINEHLLKG